jgi:sensor c-di-GMP phosphodiesterase-like protein
VRHREKLGLAAAVALAIAVPPWLAWREARQQAYASEAGLALGYARDVLHRADEAGVQAAAGIDRLARSGLAPCSAASLDLMRRILLTSPYIQAMGHVRDGVLDCSSLGRATFPLGHNRFLASSGYTFYYDVPIDGQPAPLIAAEKNGYAALIHRDLPLDIWTAVPGVALAVLHPEQHSVSVARGPVDARWLARLGRGHSVTFTDAGFLVAIAHSPRFLTSAVAALPLTDLDAKTATAAKRLVPAGIIVGMAAAVAVLLLARRRMSLEAALRNGLRRNEFFLLYQPMVDLESGACVGVEALLRWRRDTGELVGPDLFIPLAERTGLITRLTGRVLDLVERDAGGFLAAHPDFHIGINLSAEDLRSPEVAERIGQLLARCGARASNVIVEITERSFIDLESARSVIATLRRRGTEVAIDDFGTGYSSLSYLESLELDFLKIDRSFIEAIGTGAPTSQVVGHVIAMAHTLDLTMIAEGIESQAQLDFLRARGVQIGQGWLFGEPAAFADIVSAVETAPSARQAAAVRP